MARKDMSEAEFARRRKAYMQDMLEVVAKHGMAVQGVFGDDSFPMDFAYTVGLAPHGHPEFICFGVDPQVAQPMLNDIGLEHVIRRGERFQAGDLISGLVQDFDVFLVQVTDSREHLTMSNSFYGDPDGPPLPALQIVFPDEKGLFPWEPETEIAWEPVLGPVTEAGRRIALNP